MRVLLDTNVLVSAFATRGLAADVLRLVLSEHTLVTGEVVLGELARVLAKRLHLPKSRVEDILAFLREYEVAPKPATPSAVAIRDDSDRWVLASAEAAAVDVLVTGDRDLLDVAKRASVRIVDPRGFWEMASRA